MDTDNEIEKLQKSCRLCLCSEQDISIFAEHKDGLKYIDITLFLVNIDTKEDSNFPDCICMECASKLILFYKFKQKCETSNCTLTALFCNNPTDILLSKDNNEITNNNENTLNQNHHDEHETFIPINDTQHQQNKSNFQVANDINKKSSKKKKKEIISVKENEIILSQIEINCQAVKLTTPKENSLDESVVQNSTLINTSEKLFRCDFCSEEFEQKPLLLQHNLLHCVVKKFSCNLCGNRFTRKSHLVIHMRRHTNEKPYICEFCCRRFIKSGDLSRHRRIHKTEKNYLCTVCDKRFKRSSDVTCHMRTHTGERPYNCKECTKSYTSHSSLKKHLRHHVK